jgi:hypothetical protein
MQKITLSGIIMFFAAMLGVSGAWALDLSGKVLTIFVETPIPDATVELWNYADGSKQNTTTLDDGSFLFGGLASNGQGHYQLIGKKVGYIDVSSDTLNPTNNITDFILDFIPSAELDTLLPGIDQNAGYVLGYIGLTNAIDTGVEGVSISVTDFDNQPILQSSIIYLDEDYQPWDKTYTSTLGVFIIVIDPTAFGAPDPNAPDDYPNTWKDINIKGQKNGWIVGSGPWTRVFPFNATDSKIVTMYQTIGFELDNASGEEDGGDDGGGGGGGCFITTAAIGS